jgi:hypothetical protein
MLRRNRNRAPTRTSIGFGVSVFGRPGRRGGCDRSISDIQQDVLTALSHSNFPYASVRVGQFLTAFLFPSESDRPPPPFNKNFNGCFTLTREPSSPHAEPERQHRSPYLARYSAPLSRSETNPFTVVSQYMRRNATCQSDRIPTRPRRAARAEREENVNCG